MKHIKSAVRNLFLVLVISVSGCTRGEEVLSDAQHEFMESTEYGMYRNGKPEFVYIKYEHQLSVTEDGSAFRIQTDNQDRLLSCTFDAPLAADTEILVGIVSAGLSEVRDGEMVYRCLKSESGRTWLWNEENLTGIVAPL